MIGKTKKKGRNKKGRAIAFVMDKKKFKGITAITSSMESHLMKKINSYVCMAHPFPYKGCPKQLLDKYTMTICITGLRYQQLIVDSTCKGNW